MAVTPPRWTFVLTDLAGTVIGELSQLDNRTVTLPLNRLPTCSFTMPLHSSMGNVVISEPGTMVKAYRNDGTTNRLVFFGPIITVQEQADKDVQTIAVNAVGPYWRLTKRLIPGSTNKAGISFGTAGGLLEITQIAEQIVQTVNGGEYTGITVDERVSNNPANMTKVGPYQLKNAGEALAELSVMVNSFDFQVTPIEPIPNGMWPKIGSMKIVPYIGQNRPDVIYEWGGGQSNLAGYERAITREDLMTKGYITPPSWPDGTTQDLLTSSGSYVAAQTARGLFEDVVSDGGVEDAGARAQMLEEHMIHRSKAREQINVTVAPNMRPWALTDYEVGDTIRARAVARGNVRFDAAFRIWGVTFTVDKNGNEVQQLELVMPTS